MLNISKFSVILALAKEKKMMYNARN